MPVRYCCDPSFAVSVSGVASGGTFFFAAEDYVDWAYGWELWKSDGSPAGTGLVKDALAGASGSEPMDLIDLGGVLRYSADDGANGRELWSSDGTSDGTGMVADIYPGSAASSPEAFVVLAGRLYFSANDGVNGRELWVHEPE